MAKIAHNHICRTPIDSQRTACVEGKIDSIREDLLGAKAVIDMCLRNAGGNGEVLNALTLVAPALGRALEHLDQLELAAWKSSEPQLVQEAPPVQ